MMSMLHGRLCQNCLRSTISRGKALNARGAHCWQSRRTVDLLTKIPRLFEAWHENLERSRFNVKKMASIQHVRTGGHVSRQETSHSLSDMKAKTQQQEVHYKRLAADCGNAEFSLFINHYHFGN